jgi:SHS2 domain-containing protein
VTYTWVEHTAELELALEADDDRAIFADAVRAFAELLDDEHTGPEVTRELQLGAHDRASLLVDLLEEMVYLADTARFVPEELLEIDAEAGRAAVRGRTGTPPPLVKAVTYHGLQFRHENGRWRARVVLDV